jgi:hypothetical protein
MFRGKASCGIASADDFFREPPTFEYKFDAAKLNEAHEFCRGVFYNLIRTGTQFVVVDNTNTRLWEFKWYIEEAEKLGCPIMVVRMRTQYGNDKGVPDDVVERQHIRMEDYPGELHIIPSK